MVANPRRRPIVVAVLQGVVLLGVVAALAGGLVGLGFYAHVARSLPPVPPFEQIKPGGTTVITANDGQVIGEFAAEQRLDLAYDDIPPGLVLAILAAEDERFFEHSGLDLRGIARAVLTNLRAGGFVEGASTLTQQLAKSVLGRPDTFGREAVSSLVQKAREAVYARRLEDVYTKEQILLLYLNGIFLGHHSYGVRAAARNYFRKDLAELNLTEMALLAGLPQSPSRLDPLRHPERARERLVHVLEQMTRNGFITAAERDEAAAAPLVVYPLGDPFAEGAPYFTREVVQELRTRFPEEGRANAWADRELLVETTLDLPTQRAAEAALAEGLERLDRRQGYRGPLLHLEGPDRAAFLERVAEELRGRSPGEGTLWPVLVDAVDAKGADVRLTAGLTGRIALADMRWAGPYEEGKRPSLDAKLKDPARALRVGDVVLVRVRALGPPLVLALAQEPKVEGALVAIEPSSGAVRALQGGYDFDRNEVNRARSIRQTGSTIKPAIYSLAYDLGLRPSTLLSGAPFREGDYAPTRGEAKDDLIVWDALAQSENNVSLRVMNYVQHKGGLDRLRAWLAALGVTQPVGGYTAEVLGVDQTPLGMTRMMATFAARGRRVEAVFVRRISDPEGRVPVRPRAFEDPMNAPVDVLDAMVHAVTLPPERAIPETTAYLIAANLRDVFVRGTAKAEAKDMVMPACGKTGTLDYDVWFTGFTRPLAATVWIGADRRERELGTGRGKSRVYGADTALPVWRDFVNAALAHHPSEDPVGEPPPGVIVVEVDPRTGWLAREGGRRVPHVAGTEPIAFAPDRGPESDPDVLQTEF